MRPHVLRNGVQLQRERYGEVLLDSECVEQDGSCTENAEMVQEGEPGIAISDRLCRLPKDHDLARVRHKSTGE